MNVVHATTVMSAGEGIPTGQDDFDYLEFVQSEEQKAKRRLAALSYQVAPEVQQYNFPFPITTAVDGTVTQKQRLVVGGFIFNNQGKMLLLRRAPNDSFGGKWDYPGGSIEKTDLCLLDGLSREVKEEAGLITKDVCVLVGKLRWQKEDKEYTKYSFIIRVEGTDSVKLSSEHDDFHWITWEEFQQISASTPTVFLLGRGLARYKRDGDSNLLRLTSLAQAVAMDDNQRKCLVSLPYDIMFLISMKFMKKYASYSKESWLVYEGRVNFLQAIARLLDTRDAITTATPYYYKELSYATHFIYQKGVLSYVVEDTIRILDVHEAQTQEQVVDVRRILRRTVEGFRTFTTSLLCYSDELLAFLVTLDTESYLILLDISPEQPLKGRLRFMDRLDSTNRLFARVNRTTLFYGVYSLMNPNDDERHWVISCVDHTTREKVTAHRITVYNLVEKDLGCNVCFEIFGGHLYGVSVYDNTINDRSYYQCVCIPPACTWSSVRASERWRRDYLEGPTREDWAYLSLQVDDATGRLMIVECRVEYPQSKSAWNRTCYSEFLPPSSELISLQGDRHVSPSEPVMPEDLIRHKRHGNGQGTRFGQLLAAAFTSLTPKYDFPESIAEAQKRLKANPVPAYEPSKPRTFQCVKENGIHGRPTGLCIFSP
ncbi:hypothetical protein UA08_09498 [Talaromyces atroroseus]|uniref:Nudix hydrolase domain-containing protein n=1 Tax=Talaromyces atroroseus TaxID=1441469 RepID=A0A1Q5Q6A6_TALAT|nr:hypothetical protein UA08_09498 [Talaromyces atroroseus]OKL55229.1 hypothetical protein UA08_09498 [Talaromyces atroroseus]